MDDAAKRIVERFALSPHPEGGFYREVYRSTLAVRHPSLPPGVDAQRPAGTLIYFMLCDRQISAFHRVRWTDEIWHLYAGGPLELHTIDAAGDHAVHTLTTDLSAGEPTALVPAGCWQAARLAPGAAWAFGGCTVSPGFEFADFEMPAAERLVAQFPEHEAIVRAMTHG
ncbi:MAG TPA: cupin domain-containing protein [Gammaproteobacteria bacterium]|nr:cupin domain-containing protein [Gammaproteobacteria bacterium]